MLQRDNVKYLLNQLNVDYTTKASTVTLLGKLNKTLATLQESGKSLSVKKTKRS